MQQAVRSKCAQHHLGGPSPQTKRRRNWRRIAPCSLNCSASFATANGLRQLPRFNSASITLRPGVWAAVPGRPGFGGRGPARRYVSHPLQSRPPRAQRLRAPRRLGKALRRPLRPRSGRLYPLVLPRPQGLRRKRSKFPYLSAPAHIAGHSANASVSSHSASTGPPPLHCCGP